MPRFLNPPTLPRPHRHRTQAIALSGAYKRVLVAPQCGRDAAGRMAEGLEAQLTQAFDNIFAALAAAGCGPRDLVRVVGWCRDAAGAAAFEAQLEARLEGARPISAAFLVSGLPDPQAIAAIEAEAVQEAPPPR